MPQPRPARPAAAPARRTFLLGLGCEKGGTTWLYDYLERHPQVASGFSKEYHVLNAHFLASGRALQERRIARVRRLIAGLRRVPGQRRAQRLEGLAAMLAQRERQRALAADLGAYVDYFAGLADAAPDTRLVCDITPLYACLDAAALAEVRARLEAAGFEVRVIFIMRDPIERAFSSYRMSLGWTEDYAAWLLAPRLGAAQRDLQAWAEVAAGRLRQALARSPEARRRASPFLRDALEPVSRHCSSYERTIAAAEAAFPALGDPLRLLRDAVPRGGSARHHRLSRPRLPPRRLRGQPQPRPGAGAHVRLRDRHPARGLRRHLRLSPPSASAPTSSAASGATTEGEIRTERTGPAEILNTNIE